MTRATKHQVAKYVKRLRRSESVHKTRFGTIRPNRAAPLVSQPVRQGNCTTRFPACQPSKLRHPFSACRQDELYRSSSSLPAWRTIPFVFRPVSKEGCTIRFPLRARRVAPLVFCLAGKAFLGARFGKNFPNCEPRPCIRKARPGIMQRPHCELSEKGRFWLAIREIFAIATTYVCTLPSAYGGIYLDGRHVASPSQRAAWGRRLLPQRAACGRRLLHSAYGGILFWWGTLAFPSLGIRYVGILLLECL